MLWLIAYCGEPAYDRHVFRPSHARRGIAIGAFVLSQLTAVREQCATAGTGAKDCTVAQLAELCSATR